MSEYKKEMSAAVVAAIVIAAGLGAIAIYSFPWRFDLDRRPDLRSFHEHHHYEYDHDSDKFHHGVFNFKWHSALHDRRPAPPLRRGNRGQVVGLVLNSSIVQSYIVNAYSYDFSSVMPSQSNPNLLIVTVNVTGAQSVSGNYTTGYKVSYTGIRTFNATVQFAAPSIYTLHNVTVTVLPNMNQSITYNLQQQRVAQVALSNSTVKGLMGTAPFYVESVTPFPDPERDVWGRLLCLHESGEWDQKRLGYSLMAG